MDITVQAMSGAASATGDPDGPPTKSGAAFVDFSGGIHLFGAICAALFQREQTGTGPGRRGVDARHHLPDARVEPRWPPQRPRARAPRAHREPSLGHGHRAVQHLPGERRMARHHLHRRAALARRGHRPRPPRARSTTPGSSPRRTGSPTSTPSTTRCRPAPGPARVPSCSATCRPPACPCAPVKSIREVDTDEHLIERGMIQFVEHPARGRVPVAGCPLRLSDSPVGQLRPAPLLGQSTQEVLADVRAERSAGMSFTPEPGTPLATYYAETTAPRRDRPLTPPSRDARRDHHRPLRDDDRRHRPDPLRRSGGAGRRLRRRRGAAQPAGRRRRMGHRHAGERPATGRHPRRRRHAPRRPASASA